MTDLSWLSQEAKQLHEMFTSLFYSFALVLLLLGVVAEYFKLPLGGVPQFGQLAGRLLVAAILLDSYPTISNAIADFTDALASDLGSLNSIKLVLSKYYDKLLQFQVSWTSIKDSVLMLISFVTFFLLYISVYIADAAITYAWVLLYVFSPLLIVLYILPATAGATKALYRSLFEVGAWKIVWSVLATLLWSAALSQINQPQANINFITAVSYNLILAGSLLLTPFVVNSLAGAGLTSLAAQTAGIAAGAATFSPGQIMSQFSKKRVSSKGPASPGGTGAPGGGGGQLGGRSFLDRYSDEAGRNATSRLAGAQAADPKSVAVDPRKTGSASKFAQSPANSNPGAVRPANESRGNVPFKSAVTTYEPPANRTQFQRQPIQRAMFTESRKPTGK